MFFGGFGINWNMVKFVVIFFILMFLLGVIIMVGVIGMFCYMVIGISLFEGLLIGVIVVLIDVVFVFVVLCF